MGETQWLPALLAMGFGLVVASAVLLRTRAADRRARAPRPGAVSGEGDPRPDDLISLLAQLGPDDATETQSDERYAKELEAARLLRASESRASRERKPSADAPSAAGASGPEAPRRNPFMLVLMGAWLGATIVILAIFLRDQARPAAPDFSRAMSGGMPSGDSMFAESSPFAVSGVVELEPSAGPVQPTAAIFLIARAGTARQGMPVMAAKASATILPLPFRLDSAHGTDGEMPQRVTVEARLDADGDIMTRDPADLVAYAEDVAVGAKDVKLVLKRAGGEVP